MTFDTLRPLFNYLLAVGLAVTLALGLASSPQAAEREAPPASAGRPATPPAAHGPFGHSLKDLARLHDELKLDERQETLWRAAESAAKESFSGLREAMRKDHAEITALLDQPGADLRAVEQRMTEFREAGRKRQEVVRDRWLAVYDALDPAQKEKARLFVKRQFDRMAQFRERAPARGPGHEPGRPPMR